MSRTLDLPCGATTGSSTLIGRVIGLGAFAFVNGSELADPEIETVFCLEDEDGLEMSPDAAAFLRKRDSACFNKTWICSSDRLSSDEDSGSAPPAFLASSVMVGCSDEC